MPSRSLEPSPSSPGSDEPVRLSLDELAALTGLSARTVRYYIHQGLVSRPAGAKRGAYYERRHVEQLLLVRRWTQAGHSLDRVRELLAGAPEDPPPRAAAPGTVEVWSRMTIADGLELHVEPGRAELAPEQVRALLAGITAVYREIRAAAVAGTRGGGFGVDVLRDGDPADRAAVDGRGEAVDRTDEAHAPPEPSPTDADDRLDGRGHR